MQYWTWGEIREKIEGEFDLQEEPDMLSTGEMCGYLNDAIDLCEQSFITIGGGDYFFTTDTITLVAGQRDYQFPTDIYGSKIRKLLGDHGEVTRLRNIQNIQGLEGNGTPEKYVIINKKGAKPFLRLLPTPVRDGSIDIYYTRNASRIDPDGSDDQEIDIPEANLFLITYIRMMISKKEKQFQSMLDEKENLSIAKAEMITALSALVNDENNTIEPDASDYEEMY